MMERPPPLQYHRQHAVLDIDGNPINVPVVEVSIHPGSGGNLGLALAESVSWGLGVRIASIDPNGPAAKVENLHENDVTLAVNGVDFLHATLSDVKQAMDSGIAGGRPISLRLCRGLDMDRALPIVKRTIDIKLSPLRPAIEYDVTRGGPCITAVYGEQEESDGVNWPQVGDKIVSVDGESLAELSEDKISEKLSCVTYRKSAFEQTREWIASIISPQPQTCTLMLERRIAEDFDGASITPSPGTLRCYTERSVNIIREYDDPLGLELVSGPGGLGLRIRSIRAGACRDNQADVRAGDWIAVCNQRTIDSLPFFDAIELLKAPKLELLLIEDLSPTTAFLDTVELNVLIVTQAEMSRFEFNRHSSGYLCVSECDEETGSPLQKGDMVTKIGCDDSRYLSEDIDIMLTPTSHIAVLPKNSVVDSDNCIFLEHERLSVNGPISDKESITPIRLSLSLSMDEKLNLIRVERIAGNSPLARAELSVGVALIKIGETDLRDTEASIETAFELLEGMGHRNYDITIAQWPRNIVENIDSNIPAVLKISGPSTSGIVLGHVVEILRGKSGFGLEIGIEDKVGPRVVAVDPMGPNASNCDIGVGDVILEVDGESVIDCTLEEVTDILRYAGDRVSIVLASCQDLDSLYREVTVVRSAEGFGLIVDFADKYPRIRSLEAGGPASSTGKIFVGDDIIFCNGQALGDLLPTDIVPILTNTNEVNLVLQTNHSPLSVEESDSDGMSDNGDTDGDEIDEVHNSTAISNSAGNRQVTLLRCQTLGFGLKLFAELDGRNALRISHVIDDGPAAVSGRVYHGDIIDAINGQKTRAIGHKASIELLAKNSEVSLVLSDSTDPLPVENPMHKGFCVHRSSNGKFPITLESISVDGGAKVSAIDDEYKSQCTDIDAIHVGDLLVQIDGVDVSHASWPKIQRMFNNIERSSIILTVSHSCPRVSVTDDDRSNREKHEKQTPISIPRTSWPKIDFSEA